MSALASWGLVVALAVIVWVPILLAWSRSSR